MHDIDARYVKRSLPIVLAAIAIACGTSDEGRRSTPESGGRAVPESARTGESSADETQTGDETLDDGAQDASDFGDGDASANDAVAPGASASADSDGDRLPDSVETNTRVFRGQNDTGTDPRNWDSDGDGISDGDEVLVTARGLDLAKMGTNPLHRDILIEYDWFDDGSECDPHSHRPTPAALNKVTAMFARSPGRNPDGSTGIKVIHDYGQGGLFTGGNRIASDDVVLDDGVSGSEFANHRARHFASNRQGYFHYALMSHRYTYRDGDTVYDDSSGQAQIRGGDLIVSLYCYGSEDNVAGTIAHELGHNLALLHGGDSDINFKPNYNSVMNYAYQFDGIDIDCKPPGDHVLDYSSRRRPSLDESALDERRGICGDPAIDWNGNEEIEAQISQDINFDQSIGVLTDFDDWAAIVLDWHGPLSNLKKRGEVETRIATCDSRPPSR